MVRTVSNDSKKSKDNFYSKYLIFDTKKYNFKSIQQNIITDTKTLSLFKSDLFSILPKKNILGVYSDLFDCAGGFEIAIIITKLSSKESFEKIKDMLVSYFGIYQKTRNVSSIYLFDDKEFTFIELTSGSLDGDDLIKSIAEDIVKTFLKQKITISRHDFFCEIEFDDEEYNEHID